MIFLILSSAFLLYLAFPNFLNSFGFGFLAWVFAVPLFKAIWQKPLEQRMAVGILWGTFFYAGLVSWFIPYTLAGYFVFVLAMGIQPVLFTILGRSCRRSDLLDVLFWPSLWVITEYARLKLLQGFSWNLAHSQTFLPYFLPSVKSLGLWGLSFLVILINYSLFRMIFTTGRKRFYGHVMLGAAVVLMAGSVFGSVRTASSSTASLTVCAVQPSLDPRAKLNPNKVQSLVAQQAALTEQCVIGGRPDLIIWPETAIPMDFRFNPALKEKITRLARQMQTPLLLGVALQENGRDYNAAVLVDQAGRIRDIYRKRYLVPFSEYLPQNPVSQTLVKWFKIKAYDFAAGDKPGIFLLPDKGIKFGVGICSEDTVGSVFDEFRKAQAGFAVIMLNDAWFPDRTALIMHAQNMVMHAVASGLPVIRAANSGWSFLVEPDGTIKGDAALINKPAVLIHQVEVERSAGDNGGRDDTVVVFCGLTVTLNFVLLLWKGKRSAV